MESVVLSGLGAFSHVIFFLVPSLPLSLPPSLPPFLPPSPALDAAGPSPARVLQAIVERFVRFSERDGRFLAHPPGVSASSMPLSLRATSPSVPFLPSSSTALDCLLPRFGRGKRDTGGRTEGGWPLTGMHASLCGNQGISQVVSGREHKVFQTGPGQEATPTYSNVCVPDHFDLHFDLSNYCYA